MRNNYAEIPQNVWKEALDYPGKDNHMPEKKTYSEAELDAMIERQNKRLDEKERGRKILEFANTPINEREVPEERQEPVARQVESVVDTMSAEDAAQEVESIAKSEKVSPNAVWQSANDFLRAEKYEPDKAKLKFYYPLTADEAAGFLKTGEITGPSNDNPLESGLGLTADYKDSDGYWQSGYNLDGRDVERNVTLILDGSLLDTDGFMAIGRNPRTRSIDLRKSCVGIINEGDNANITTLRYLSRRNKLPLPIYKRYDQDGRDLWSNNPIGAESFRIVRDRKQFQMEAEKVIAAEVYDHVNQQGIEEATKISLERDKNSSAEKLMRLSPNLSSEQERHQAEQAALEYYCNLLDIRSEVRIRHYRDENDHSVAVYEHKSGSPFSTIHVNDARMDTVNLETLVEIFAHELWHGREKDYIDRLEAHQLDGDAKRRAELYKYNFYNYIPLELDAEGYEKQLVEVEAEYFGQQSKKVFVQKYAEAHRPANRFKRGLSRVLGRK